MIIVVPAAKDFISEELVMLWNENFPTAAVSYGLHDFTIYFNSYHMVGNPCNEYYLPVEKDLLCVINYKNKSASYYINGKRFETEKDYIAALKNIAFL